MIKDFVDRFVYQIIQQDDDHYIWILNLLPGKKQSIIAKVQGRKGKACTELKSNLTATENDHNNDNTEKDDPYEDLSS